MKDFAERVREYNETRNPIDRSSFCHAPSVNLNFEQTGNVTACCFNRRFILGNYPKESIVNIWNGERAQELRNRLAKNDLSKGCQLCQHQLEAGNYTGIRSKGFDKLLVQNTLAPMPRVMEFEISNACNLECIMCNGYFSSSIRRNREKLEPMPTFYDDAFVDQLRPFLPHLVDMKFLGGEPFLNPLYFKIWDAVMEENPSINVVITTNGTVFNERVKRVLEKIKPAITVSLDSLDQTTYQSIRKNGDFAKVIENLTFFIQLNRQTNKGMSIAVCPMQQNWETIPEILNFCNENGIYLGMNTVVWPPECSIKTMPQPKIKKIHKFFESYLPPEEIDNSRWWIKENRDSYMGMLNQVGLWAHQGTN